MGKIKSIIAKLRELLADTKYAELINETAVIYMAETPEGSLELSSLGFHKNRRSIIVGNMRVVYVDTSDEYEKIILYRYNDFDDILKLKK